MASSCCCLHLLPETLALTLTHEIGYPSTPRTVRLPIFQALVIALLFVQLMNYLSFQPRFGVIPGAVDGSTGVHITQGAA